ncbi:MAG: response regulator [Myxococcota bacterium]
MRRAHVLVVDPNPATLQRVSSALAGSAYEVLSARDALEAQKKANEHDIAVVLSSTGLPRGNGYDLARTLLSRWPSTKFFLMSGGFEVYNRDRAEQAGVTGRISKPFSPDGLRARLEAVLGSLHAPDSYEYEYADIYDDDDAPEPRPASIVLPGIPRATTPVPKPAGGGDGLQISLNTRGDFIPDEDDEVTIDELPDLDGSFMEPLLPTDELNAADTDRRADYRPPQSAERVATIIPRDYEHIPAVAASIKNLDPAVEAAVLEVLPEVVEAILRRVLQSSPAFRDLVAVAVDEAVRAHLPSIARRVVRERLAEIEATDSKDI